MAGAYQNGQVPKTTGLMGFQLAGRGRCVRILAVFHRIKHKSNSLFFFFFLKGVVQGGWKLLWKCQPVGLHQEPLWSLIYKEKWILEWGLSPRFSGEIFWRSWLPWGRQGLASLPSVWELSQFPEDLLWSVPLHKHGKGESEREPAVLLLATCDS